MQTNNYLDTPTNFQISLKGMHMIQSNALTLTLVRNIVLMQSTIRHCCLV